MAKAYRIGEVAELAEGTTLLTWQGLISLEGSNPSLSAVNFSERRRGARQLLGVREGFERRSDVS